MNNLWTPLFVGLLVWPFAGLQSAVLIAVTVAVGKILVHIIRRLRLTGRGTLPLLEGISSHLQIAPHIRLRVGALVVVLLLVMPFFMNNYALDIAGLIWLYAILAVGLNITVGYVGILDLGYAAFYGVGAYTYAILSTQAGVTFWVGLPLGACMAAVLGLLLGIITLRLRGDYTAIVTLGLVQITYLVLNSWDSVTNGPNGILQIAPPSIAGFALYQPAHFYYLGLALLGMTLLVVYRLASTHIGRGWVAIREDELAAESVGIHSTQLKILAFVLGAGVAGMAGVFFAARYSFISPESFNFAESIRILSMVVIGGMGSLPGVILGACLMTLLPEMLREFEHYRTLIFGAALVLVMVFRPQGLLGRRG